MASVLGRPRVLVVDDHVEMAETVATSLRSRGFETRAISTAEEAMSVIALAEHDALVTDLRIPGTDGLDLLAQSRAAAPESPVIVMTAFSGIDTAIESIRRGAYHYVTKPFGADELALFLKRALDESALRREARSLRSALRSPLDNVVGDSPAMRNVFDLVRRIANSSAPVLLLGETGTGKGVIARAIHAESHRAAEPFVVVNCAAIPETLLESELFGHVRGAFTGATAERTGLFEQANRGTLYLDEIAELPVQLQAKLLHVLETGKVRPVGSNAERAIDVRILAATHRSLKKRIAEKAFREDLMYRLDVLSVEVPALRHRLDDLPKLVARFAADAARRNPGSPPLRISAEVMDALMRHSWPGNVRELEHLVERLTLLCVGGMATLTDLPESILGQVERPIEAAFGNQVVPLRELQRRYVAWALKRLGGAKMATCEALGIDSKTLNRWLRLEDDDE